MATKAKNYHTRKPTDGLPSPATRLPGFTINGTYIPAERLPQTSYLDQVKYVGATFFEAALKSTDVRLCFGQEQVTAPGVRVSPELLRRAVDALYNLEGGGDEEKQLLAELMKHAGLA